MRSIVTCSCRALSSYGIVSFIPPLRIPFFIPLCPSEIHRKYVLNHHYLARSPQDLFFMAASRGLIETPIIPSPPIRQTGGCSPTFSFPFPYCPMPRNLPALTANLILSHPGPLFFGRPFFFSSSIDSFQL